MSHDKVKEIVELHAPQNVDKVREALGLINSHEGFILRYADMCAPLHALTTKDIPWDWTSECEKNWQSNPGSNTEGRVLVFL